MGGRRRSCRGSRPRTGELGLAGRRLGEAHRRFDGLGAAGVELGPVEVAGGQIGDQLDQPGPVLGREAADVDPGQLPAHGPDVLRMRVPEAGDADPREQVEVAVAVGVEQHGALAPLDAEPAEEGHALGAGGEMQRFGGELRLGAGAGKLGGGDGVGQRITPRRKGEGNGWRWRRPGGSRTGA